MSFKLKIQTKTWSKDNYGLFDYDLEKDMILKEMVVKTEGTLARRLDEVFYHTKSRKGGSTNESQDDAPMLTIKQTEGGVKVCQPDGNSKQQVLWKQVSRNNNEFACINKGDTFRLGKKQFTVLQVYLGGKKQMILDLEKHYNVSNIMKTFISEMDSSMTSQGSMHGDAPITDKSEHMEKSERMPCRICLSSSTSRKNPLLAPCQCKGSARWIHFECLQQWINQRIQISEKAHYANIRTKCIKCELCMTLLPSSVTVGSVQYLLYQFKNLKYEKFLVLEDSDGLIFMLNLTSKTSFNIGRGHDCDIKLSEITVSRKHMRLEIDASARIKLFDLNSKFGTLVKILKPLIIPYETPLELQNGRTHIKLRLIQQKSRFRTFFSKLCGCGRDELELRNEMKQPDRYESIRYYPESQSAQLEEGVYYDEDSQLQNQLAPEFSPQRGIEESEYNNITGEMNFQNQQDPNQFRQLGISQRQGLLGRSEDISLRLPTQPRDIRNSSVGTVGAIGSSQARPFYQLTFSLRQRNTSLQRQESLLERAPTSHYQNHLVEQSDSHGQGHMAQLAGEIRIENEEEEQERLETDQQDTILQERIERSNSVPSSIPHSNSAPSNIGLNLPFRNR